MSLTPNPIFPATCLICPTLLPSGKRYLLHGLLLIKSIISSVKLSSKQFHYLCNTCSFLQYAAKGLAVFYSTFMTNIFNPSAVRLSVTQFYILCNISCLSQHAATCQTVLPCLSVANNNLCFVYYVVRISLAQSHTFRKMFHLPNIAAKVREVILSWS
jgi:hypothetical protein